MFQMLRSDFIFPQKTAESNFDRQEGEAIQFALMHLIDVTAFTDMNHMILK